MSRSAASRPHRNVTISVLAKNEQAARELMAELAPDHRVVAITASLGDGKYLIPSASGRTEKVKARRATNEDVATYGR